MNFEKKQSANNKNRLVNNKKQIETYIKSFKESFYSNDMNELNSLAGKIFEFGEEAMPELLNIISGQGNDPLLRKMDIY